VARISLQPGEAAAKARSAVDTVVGYLKERLPETMDSKLDGAVSGESSSGGVEAAAKGIGGMFGKK
jgi:hypothetical protein